MDQPNFIVVSQNNVAKEKICDEIKQSFQEAPIMHCYSLEGLWRYVTVHSSSTEKVLTIYIEASVYEEITTCTDHLVLLWVIASKLKKEFLIYVFSDDVDLLYATGLPHSHLVHTGQVKTK